MTFEQAASIPEFWYGLTLMLGVAAILFLGCLMIYDGVLDYLDRREFKKNK